MQRAAAVHKRAAQEQFGKVFADSGYRRLQKTRNTAPCLHLDLMDHDVKPDPQIAESAMRWYTCLANYALHASSIVQ